MRVNLYLVVLISSIKFFIVFFQPFHFSFGPHDDGLFLNNAISISNGDWLGDYSSFSMIKGPILPAIISLTSYTPIFFTVWLNMIYIFFSYLISNELYKNFFKQNSRILFYSIFIVILFLPISMSDSVSNRLLRDFTFLILFMIFIYQLLLIIRHFHNGNKSCLYVFLMAVILSTLSLLREDFWWILIPLPLIFFYLGFTLKHYFVLLFSFTILPCIAIILNSYFYNAPVVNTLYFGSFNKVLSIMEDHQYELINPRVAIDYSTRKILYDKSPTFKTLEKGIEDRSRWWWVGRDHLYSINLMWGIRHVADESKQYSSYKKSDSFYSKISNELSQKKIDSKSSLVKQVNYLVNNKNQINYVFNYLEIFGLILSGTDLKYGERKVINPNKLEKYNFVFKSLPPFNDYLYNISKTLFSIIKYLYFMILYLLILFGTLNAKYFFKWLHKNKSFSIIFYSNLFFVFIRIAMINHSDFFYFISKHFYYLITTYFNLAIISIFIIAFMFDKFFNTIKIKDLS